jgi:hypothetical protein
MFLPHEMARFIVEPRRDGSSASAGLGRDRKFVTNKVFPTTDRVLKGISMLVPTALKGKIGHGVSEPLPEEIPVEIRFKGVIPE